METAAGSDRRRTTRTRRALYGCTAPLLAGTLITSPVRAQTPVQIITGVVRNEAGMPLPDALVTLDPSQLQVRRMRTDSAGRFHFTRVFVGPHVLGTVRIGYLPDERNIVLPDTGLRLEIMLRLLPRSLDSVRIVARQTGVFGAVLTRELGPVDRADVKLLPDGPAGRAGNDGRFEIFRNVKIGPQVLLAKRTGYLQKMLSITVPKDSAVEVAMLLDTVAMAGGNRRTMALADFERRVSWAGARAALITADELAGMEGQSAKSALRSARSFQKRGLIILDEAACIFVDGIPQPFASVNDFAAEDIEAIEIYGVRGDWTNTLMERWPRFVPCGNDPEKSKPRDFTGGSASALVGVQPRGVRSRRVAIDSYVRAINIWLKR